ncbi:MAG: hypothetical protein WCG27_05055 [Pseudomonadota bacterium]
MAEYCEDAISDTERCAARNKWLSENLLKVSEEVIKNPDYRLSVTADPADGQILTGKDLWVSYKGRKKYQFTDFVLQKTSVLEQEQYQTCYGKAQKEADEKLKAVIRKLRD